MSDPETDSHKVHVLPAREQTLPALKEYTGIPGLGAPQTNDTHKWTNFLLDQREKALRAGRRRQAERLLNAAWEAYFRGR